MPRPPCAKPADPLTALQLFVRWTASTLLSMPVVAGRQRPALASLEVVSRSVMSFFVWSVFCADALSNYSYAVCFGWKPGAPGWAAGGLGAAEQG